MTASAPTPSSLHFSGSYVPEDVEFLLTRMSLRPTPVAEKERLIQTGRRHYSEMISPERPPGPVYMRLYQDALGRNGPRLAQHIAALAAALAQRAAGREVVLVSLARAGTPVGVLLHRALRRMGVPSNHYSISIIRDRGVDAAALAHITARHHGRDVVFVDGWTGKGVIARELRASAAESVLQARPYLAVVADPAGAADLAATGEDYVIPSGLLNGVASGLVSRSIFDPELVRAGRYHGCVRLDALAPHDVSRAFVDTIEAMSPAGPVPPVEWPADRRAAFAALSREAVAAIADACRVNDLNRIKPGAAEATRAVLRRVPDRLFLSDPADPDLAHLVHLAAERGLPVQALPAGEPYKAVAVIKSLGAD